MEKPFKAAYCPPAVCCMFTGHRELPGKEELQKLQKKTEEAVRTVYSKGCRHFYAGGAIGFDMLASVVILNMRQRELPGMTLTLVLPHFGHYKNWAKSQKNVFSSVLERADEVIYLNRSYISGCMHQRNRYMADRSAYCICYLKKQTGGTAYTVRYAKDRNVDVINLANEE